MYKKALLKREVNAREWTCFLEADDWESSPEDFERVAARGIGTCDCTPFITGSFYQDLNDVFGVPLCETTLFVGNTCPNPIIPLGSFMGLGFVFEYPNGRVGRM